MTPERWQQVKAFLHEAMQLQGTRRVAFLARVADTDVSMRGELDRLLSANEQLAPEFLDSPAAAAWDEVPSPGRMIGQRLGAYQIIEKIGAGGMGEVYRATRADDEFQQKVAIKLVHSTFASAFVLARLRRERQILASLDHPHITRLLDGGRTTDGIPYLVMELIEGEPITIYCARQGYTVEEKLRLFIQVCLAVHYAHQRLIIHRDIKPGNILVTSAGSPKLLDFGIAKILDQSASANGSDPQSPTASVIRLYTPGYASPEQLKGETITTSTDVFSLGVVLDELLTDPATGEKARNKHGGNLDKIIQMATRSDPEQRYRSAEALADDILRHLDHLPVIARSNTLKYRFSTFVARHTSAIAASALLAISLLVATVVSMYEARVAQTERARAERRFSDARRLANSLMREIYGSIKDLPGATSARKLLVSKALEYLDGLSDDALSDAALEKELATAYSLVGDVQGNPYFANLGDPTGAYASARKALAIRLRLSAEAPADVDAVRSIAGSYNQLGTIAGVTRDFSAATGYFEAAALLLEGVDKSTTDAMALDQLAGTHYFVAEAALRSGNLTRAADAIARASAVRDSIITRDAAQSRLIRTHSAADHSAAARVLVSRKNYPEALVEQRKAVDIVIALAQDNPGDGTLRSYVGMGFDYLGRIQEYLDDQNGALESYRRASETMEPIVAVDAENIFAVSLLAHGYERIGSLNDERPGSNLLGSQDIAKAIKLIMPASEKAPNNAELKAQLAYAFAELAADLQLEALRPSGVPQRVPLLGQACDASRKSAELWRELNKSGSLDAFERSEGSPADAEKNLGQCELLLTQTRLSKPLR